MMNSVLYWLLLTMFHRTVYSYQKIGMNTVNTVNTVSNRRKISRWITMSSHDNHFHSNYLANQASVWCGLNGLMYTDGQYNWSSAPISLLPNEFPRKEFHSLQKLQPQLNLLSDRISRDKEFIIEQLSLAATTDIFLQKLLQLYQRIPDEIVTNSIQCGLFRSDYMLNNNGKPLQIEINTIASSFGCLSRKVYELQQFLLTRNTVNNEKEIQKLMKSVELSSHTDSIALKNLMIDNPSIKALANGLAQAYKAVGDNNAIILFIVQPNERNIADQRLLEAELWSTHNIPVEFQTLTELSDSASLDQNKNLILSFSGAIKRVSVAYYRAGYAPTDYFSDKEWLSRETIEFSNAIKCPTVGLQLAGTKIIQAALCQEKLIEKYLPNSDSKLISNVFASQYNFGPSQTTAESTAALESAIADGSKWVLKPQREGGGNNLYGKELSEFASKHRNDGVLNEYVLMQRIFPTVQKTAFFRKGMISVQPSISELGVYGTYLGDGTDQGVILNEYAGYLLRTKADGVDEGGVATGYSVLNSIALIDSK